MSNLTVKDAWSQLKESLKQSYSNLKDEDLRYVEGKEEETYGKIGKRLNMTKEQVDKIVNEHFLKVKGKLENAKAKQ
jgi:uncharacterized protein YjbJ (UPF0337 family)